MRLVGACAPSGTFRIHPGPPGAIDRFLSGNRSTNQCILMQFSRSSKSPDKRWYLGVICAKCRTPILFGLDRTEGKGPFEPPAMLFLTCSEAECGHRADYSGAKVSAHQKNP